jgi:PilZ domain
MVMTAPSDPRDFTFGMEPIQRRERRPVSMQAFIATDGGATGEAIVLDLSYEGCGIETAVVLTPGNTVTLSVLGKPGLKAEVCWYADGKGGLTFAKEPVAAKQQRPRAKERVAVVVNAQLRRLGMTNFNVSVFDLSPEGCKVEVVERPRLGEHLHLKLEGIEAIGAEVCWVENFFAGLRFERRIHDAVFNLLVDRLTAAD